MERLNRPASEDEVPNIDRLFAVFTVNKKDDGKPDPSIKSWAHPAVSLKDMLKNIINLK